MMPLPFSYAELIVSLERSVHKRGRQQSCKPLLRDFLHAAADAACRRYAIDYDYASFYFHQRRSRRGNKQNRRRFFVAYVAALFLSHIQSAIHAY